MLAENQEHPLKTEAQANSKPGDELSAAGERYFLRQALGYRPEPKRIDQIKGKQLRPLPVSGKKAKVKILKK